MQINLEVTVTRCLLVFCLILSSVCGYSNELPIRIGAPLPLTGALAPEAEKQKRGYELWADYVNQSGGVLVGETRRPVNIIYLDYRSKTEAARGAAEFLVTERHVDLLFAPYGSNAARAASPIAEKYQIPMIAVTASSTQTYSRGHSYLFGTFTPNESLTESMVDAIKQQVPDTQSIALLIRDDLFPKSIARAMINSSKLRGIDTQYYGLYDVKAATHLTEINALKAANADWIFVAGYMTDLTQIRKEMAELGVTAKVMSMIAAPAYQEFIDQIGPLAENITSAAWWHPAVRYQGNDIFGSSEHFVELFQQRYGSLPDYVEASAAAAGALFQMAIERAESLDGVAVRNELARINDRTFWGMVRFGRNGQNDHLLPPVFQIQNGKTVIIYPLEIANGTLKTGVGLHFE